MGQTVGVSIKSLKEAGVEVLPRNSSRLINLPVGAIFEAPCSLKWLEAQHSFSMGAFSYHVSGYAFATQIGRYCSIAENVQIGRQNHPTHWASTSPAFYLQTHRWRARCRHTGCAGLRGRCWQSRTNSENAIAGTVDLALLEKQMVAVRALAARRMRRYKPGKFRPPGSTPEQQDPF